MINEARSIVKALQDKGYIAYFAGGSVRDIILGRTPADIDIATSATPDEVESILPSTVPIGKQFGIILVNQGGHGFEVATFRIEEEHLDGRRPSKIEFSSAQEDAQRRDFTINGLFFDPIKDEIIDYVHGQADIKKHLIKFIGKPEDRIKEDHLRIIRAIRFKTTLAFQYDKETFAAVKKYSQLIKNVSVERIRDELNKIMASEHRHVGLAELSESGILSQIIPEIEGLKSVPQPYEFHKEGDVFVHTYLALRSLPKDCPTHLAWAVLLHDIGKPQTLIRKDERIIFHDHAKISAQIAKTILQRLKFPKFETDTICYLVENHMKVAQLGQMRPAKRFDFVSDFRFNDLLRLVEADVDGTIPPDHAFVKKLRQEVDAAIAWQKEKSQVVEKQILKGDDLIEMGFSPGEQFKKILGDVSSKVIEGVIINKSEAKSYVTSKYKNENIT